VLNRAEKLAYLHADAKQRKTSLWPNPQSNGGTSESFSGKLIIHVSTVSLDKEME
jgi:hypothetical protein